VSVRIDVDARPTADDDVVRYHGCRTAEGFDAFDGVDDQVAGDNRAAPATGDCTLYAFNPGIGQSAALLEVNHIDVVENGIVDGQYSLVAVENAIELRDREIEVGIDGVDE
jgi:hypothetical protein